MNKDLIDDTQALLGGHADANGTTRRFALKAVIGVGYAAAAMPIIAQTAIKTPVAGLVAGEVTIDVNGFKMPDPIPPLDGILRVCAVIAGQDRLGVRLRDGIAFGSL